MTDPPDFVSDSGNQSKEKPKSPINYGRFVESFHITSHLLATPATPAYNAAIIKLV